MCFLPKGSLCWALFWEMLRSSWPHFEMKATDKRTLLDRIPLMSDLQSGRLTQGGRAPGGG